MSDIHEVDDLTKAVDAPSTPLRRWLTDRLGVATELDRVEIVTTMERTTLTVVVSWDPCARLRRVTEEDRADGAS